LPASACAPPIEQHRVVRGVAAAGKTIVRITTKEALRNVPPNFASPVPRASPSTSRIPSTPRRASQDIGQGELRSMNVVQGSDRTRAGLNLRRPVAHETSLDGSAW